LVREADRITPEIAARAAELTKGARSEREKVLALYDFVTRLRYVAIPLGVNSLRPHAASATLANRYGDCKDKANLFNALLRSQGIAADLVLVPRFTQADDGVPGLGFNHAISRLTLGGETVWADTTDDVSRFGLLPPGDPGRKVLVVGDSGPPAALTALPPPLPEAHRLAIAGQLKGAVDGTFAGAVTARAQGYADYALRNASRQAAAQLSTRPILAEELRPTAGAFAMSAQTATPAAALDREVEWRGEGSWSGLAAALPGGGVLLRAPFWLPREWEAALHPRRSPLFLNQGYPLALAEEIELQLPPGARAGALPRPAANDAGPLRWSVAWTRRDAPSGLRYVARLDLTLRSGELDSGETRLFQQQLRALVETLGSGGTYALAP
ncbi:MAG TPA: transglutaminase domain-containing protein, partial [Thermoanaerobaculia bacterium]